MDNSWKSFRTQEQKSFGTQFQNIGFLLSPQKHKELKITDNPNDGTFFNQQSGEITSLFAWLSKSVLHR